MKEMALCDRCRREYPADEDAVELFRIRGKELICHTCKEDIDLP